MSNDTTSPRDWALFAVRLAVAFIFLWHGVPKAIDPAAAFEKFVGFGLPGALGPVTGVVETIAALFILAGVFHRTASIVLAVVIVGALVTVQIPGGFTAGFERDLLLLVATILLIIEGPGYFTTTRLIPKTLTTREAAQPGR